MHPGSGLLSLPPEIRLLIWHFVVEGTYVHVLEDGSTICDAMVKGMCSGPQDCHRHLSFRISKCNNCKVGRLFGLNSTCRMIYHETNSRIYQDLFMSFASGPAFWTFINRKLETSHLTTFSLKWLVKVHIDIGPAKHANTATNYHSRGAIWALARDATNLKVLKLTMGYYLQAQRETILLNSKILQAILQFRDLDQIALQMHTPPPGPVGVSNEASSSISVDQKLACLEDVLQYYVRRQR